MDMDRINGLALELLTSALDCKQRGGETSSADVATLTAVLEDLENDAGLAALLWSLARFSADLMCSVAGFYDRDPQEVLAQYGSVVRARAWEDQGDGQ